MKSICKQERIGDPARWVADGIGDRCPGTGCKPDRIFVLQGYASAVFVLRFIRRLPYVATGIGLKNRHSPV